MSDTSIIDAILRREGGFVDHPDDRGGPTKYGITAETLEAYRGGPVTVDDIQTLTEAEARQIYRTRYLEGPGFNRVDHAPLRALLVDCAVNHGPVRAVRWLQQAVGTQADGRIGPKTRAALGATDAGRVYRKVLAERCKFYGQLISSDRSQAVFARGWTVRLAEFMEAEV